jgi:undecaprenyl-diphosphatase
MQVMNLWQVLLLAVVQGITEFLPISSDGHLVIVMEYLKSQGAQVDAPALIIALHMGTLLSVVVFYWRKLWSLLYADVRVIPLLIIATIPAVIIGLTIKKLCPHILENALLAGLMLPFTGMFLLWGEKQAPANGDYRDLPWWKTLCIGLAQASAILPGLSRSGSTISTGLALGLSRQSAATFSFLMAVPVIAGAGILEAFSMWKKNDFSAGGIAIPHLLAGILVSFLVGLAAIWVLVRVLEAGRLRWFAIYCIVLGLVIIVWQLSKNNGLVL